MSLRRFFVAAASILACMTSVQTPKVDDVGLSILPSIPRLPILPVCVGDEDRRLPVSRANFSGDYDAYLIVRPVFQYHVVHAEPPHLIQPASTPSTLDAALLRINAGLPDIDIDKLQLIYLFTASFARFLKRNIRVRWTVILRTVLVLGGMLISVGLGVGDQQTTTKELTSLIRPTIASLHRSARSSYYQRTARIIQNLCRSLNPCYLLNFVPLPFDVPLEHLISALALNGMIVSILERFSLGRRLLSTIFPDPTPWIRRTKKRYKRGPKNKNKVL
ncbi:hypothetical protein C8R46DRAFT_1217897 [Mycena filopes]|nr:hypothetical protein C8R46DRAFT_1224462 [Mycena filopes]KAJ7168489.1 hypothetical protein C8R46DRAFT_1217897 [Mycena filopes]